MSRNSIGQFISALRKANGMTQQEVAERLNVSNKAVSRWERDETAPDITLIPPLAEMLGVTCDELLRGERISGEPQREKAEPKVEKQVKSLIDRTVSGFKTLIFISVAVALAGLVCMFGTAYGFYRPVIGFAVMLLVEICALAIALSAVSRARSVKNGNELFAKADKQLSDSFNNALSAFSFTAFFVILAVVLLSLPLIFKTDGYYVLDFNDYFSHFFGGEVLIAALAFLKLKKPYTEWITHNSPDTKPDNPTNRMTAIQTGLTVIAGLIFISAPYLENRYSDLLFFVVEYSGLACIIGSIVCFTVCLVRNRGERKLFLLRGIRNLCFIPSAFMLSDVHYVVWLDGDGRFDGWNTEHLRYSIVLIIAVSVVFSVIEELIKNRQKARKRD